MNSSGVLEWRQRVLAEEHLTPKERRVALALADCSNPVNGIIVVPANQLARRAGVDTNTVYRHLKNLRTLGLVRRRRERSLYGGAVYVLQFPEE